MRKYAILRNAISEIKKVMLFESSDGVYLFLYNTIEDVLAFADNYFCTVQDAEEMCEEDYKINQSDWIDISDPLRHCKHDVISPIRIKGREAGKPQWGKFEKLENGEWIDYEFIQK